jgi:hypothetical protein
MFAARNCHAIRIAGPVNSTYPHLGGRAAKRINVGWPTRHGGSRRAPAAEVDCAGDDPRAVQPVRRPCQPRPGARSPGAAREHFAAVSAAGACRPGCRRSRRTVRTRRPSPHAPESARTAEAMVLVLGVMLRRNRHAGRVDGQASPNATPGLIISTRRSLPRVHRPAPSRPAARVLVRLCRCAGRCQIPDSPRPCGRPAQFPDDMVR